MLRFVRIPKKINVIKSIQGVAYIQSSRLCSTHNWSVNKVRDVFVDYFADEKAHSRIKASPVVPVNDPTLLFTNAGMNQFKSIFLGTVEPNSHFYHLKRAANSQKCIRAGGKHNDLTDVGKDTYHHTFFEMLGTWSFGDYFKEEAIEWALDLLLNKYKLPKDRIYVSYFAGCDHMGIPCDIESRDIWLRHLPSERVLPFGSKENFWEMGDTGPCGPCSEIHFDTIGERDAAHLVNSDDPTVMEIWNLVFMQYRKDKEASSDMITLKPLPAAHVDTGMGLERITAILQNKTSNYDTDVFMPLLTAIHSLCEGSCAPYGGVVTSAASESLQQQTAPAFSRQELERDVAYRAIADHIRTLCVAIADGALPSNEHRGYVLRRIVRRAIR
jgi:alanyl-tRNA synthetase